jgi:hypothetical protein
VSVLFNNQTDKNNNLVVYCTAQNDEGDEFLAGAIRINKEGYWVFHVGRKVILTCSNLKQLSKKISDMNKIDRNKL